MSDASTPRLQIRGLVKRFPGVLALDGVDFDLFPGEVHALMGENGAGKSTLIKSLTGVYSADGGEITLEGQPIAIHSPLEAVKHGISTVYQEVNLAPNLSVAENIALGREQIGVFGIKWKACRERAERALSRVGLSVDVRLPLRSCSIAVQQMVAIARALDVSAKVLILDEPTSSLDKDEVAQLFEVVRRLRSDGLSIVFVTHFLDQVYEISDRITVLRNGKRVGSWKAADLSRLELVTQMIGRDAAELEKPVELRDEQPTDNKPFVVAEGVGRRGSVDGINVQIGSGEVLGFAGLLGSGRTECVRLLFGLDAVDSGNLSIDGKPVRHYGPRAAIRRGFGLCAEDRKREGLLPELSIRENIVVAMQARQGWLRPVSAARQTEMANEFVKRLQIHPPDIDRPIQNLSGGNQQKVLLARWLAAEPRLLLLDEPTRGIDVGAKFEIMSLVEELRKQGMAFVFVSSELAEVVRTCTSVLVMRDRRLVGRLKGSEATEDGIIDTIAEAAK